MQMRKKILPLVTLLLTTAIASVLVSCNYGDMSNEMIVENDDYIVTGDSVVMGPYHAYSHDGQSIVTNYTSQSADSIPNVIKFRLTIGSRDIELLPAHYHYIDLENTVDTLTFQAFKPDSVKLKATHNITIPNSLKLKIDLSELTKSITNKGHFVTPTRDTIYRQDFEQSMIEMHIDPGNPDLAFKTRISHPSREDGISEIQLQLRTIFSHRNKSYTNWKMSDEGQTWTPRFNSKQPILNALYNMSMQQVMPPNASRYSSLVAGECYAIALSLAYLQPQQSMERLKSMVIDSVISLEPGNRSYPSLVNDLIWSQAAWSVYCATADKTWLIYSYKVIVNSLNQVKDIMLNPQTGLYHAMSPYISSQSWQYYPSWMSTSDAFETIPLVGNAIMEHTYRLLGLIADEFEQNIDYDTPADHIKDAINHRLWNENNEYYTQYLYGGVSYFMSPCIDNLGQGLSILWDIADDDRAESLIKKTPLSNFGVPLLYPNRVNAGTGINNTVVPMIQAIWNLAAAKTGDMNILRRGMGALIAQQALAASCATSCNATTGELLSGNGHGNAAGNIAMILRVIAGMNFLPNGIEFNPKVPVCFAGTKHISQFHYRDAVLDITIKGTGDDLDKITLDGKVLASNFIEGSLKGNHKIVIEMNDRYSGSGAATQAAKMKLLPEEPKWSWDGYYGTNYTYSSQLGYRIFINGEATYAMRDSVLGTRDTVTYRSYSIVAINRYGHSFISKPHYITTSAQCYPFIQHAPSLATTMPALNTLSHHPITLADDTTWVEIPVHTNEAGDYILDVLYGNGNGAPSMWSPCDMLKIIANGHSQGVVSTPQLGVNQWLTMQYSSHLNIKLLKGNNVIKLCRLRPGSLTVGDDMIVLDHLRLIKR